MRKLFPVIYDNLIQKFHITAWEEINAGWSDDKKFCVTAENGEKFMLRISPAEYAERKKQFFELALRVAALDISMSRPVVFETCEEGAYSLYTWIDGKDAADVVPGLSEEEQYQYGVDAGRILQKIHTIPAPEGLEDWESRFNRKMDSKIEQYSNCSLKYEEDECILEYIKENRHLLKNRPQCYQHGDYHIGNMMIGRDGALYIIDFDRDDFGDPWEEFNRIIWCVNESRAFSSGMVSGYFDGNVPMEFWRLLALYMSNNTLSSLPWAMRFGQSQIDVMIKNQKEILDWYEHMKNPVPKWYRTYK